MLYLLILAMAVCALGGALAAPVTTVDNGTWTLENDALRVTIDQQAGTFQVLDKASAYLWKGPDGPAAQPPQIVVRRAQETPTVNGDLEGWAERQGRIALTPDMLADARTVSGPQDLSGQVQVLWHDDGLYLAVQVRDEKIVTAAADEMQWWEKDSVEFWLNERQFAVRFGPWGANLWSAAGAVAGAQVAWRPTADGYAVEVGMPTKLLGLPGAPTPGGAFRFALGINDCDGGDGRQGQLYFPTTWKHSNPDTFALAVLADEQGRVPEVKPETKPALMPAEGPRAPGTATFEGTVKSGGKSIPVTYSFALDGDKPDLLISVAVADESTPVGQFAVLHPLVLDRPGEILAATYSDGFGFPTDDLSRNGTQWWTSSSLDMPWVGLTDGAIGYLLLWELPVSCDNGVARLEAARVGDRMLLVPSAQHVGIKGKFGPPRTVRYSFTSTGGHVAICKRYRQYAVEHGILKTQKEKMKTKPALERLAGAPDVWGRSDLKFCQEAKAAGIDRLLVNGAQPAKDMEAIKALGFLISTYDNYEDAFEGDRGHYGDFKTDTDSVVLANGQLMKAWITHDEPPKQFMKRCTALFEGVARTWIPKDLANYPYNARFLDVTTACGMIECYSDRHPLDRTQDREARRKLAKYVGDELGLVLGGEHGRWYGADIYNYWEGMQSGGHYSWPAGYVGEKIPQTAEEVGKAYLEWGLGETHRLPLWELVFHDCVVSTWYWGDSTGHLRKAMPELGYKQDAFNILYGTVPLYWVNQDYSYRWDKEDTRARLLESYRNTCKLHEAIGFEEMVSHEYVTPDREVQKTVFGDGTQVWVNFGKNDWTLKLEGQEFVLPQYGFYAKGPQIEQYRIVKKWDIEQYKGLDAIARGIGGIGENHADGRVTCIRKDGYVYVNGDVPGLVEAFLGAGVAVKRESPTRMRLIPEPTKWLRVNWRAICPEAGEGDWCLVELDAEGHPARLGQRVKVKDDMLLLPEGAPLQPCLLIGPKELAGMAELAFVYEQKPMQTLNQGEPGTGTVKIVNLGGKDAHGVVLAAYEGPISAGKRVETRTLDIPAGVTIEQSFTFPTDKMDYRGGYSLKIDDADAIPELCESDNVSSIGWIIKPNWALWDGQLEVTVDMGAVSRRNPVVSMPFDPDAEWAKLGKTGKADLAALRVERLDAEWPSNVCPCQLADDPVAGRKLIWRLYGDFEPGATVKCRIYMDGAEAARHLPSTYGSGWNEETQTYNAGRLVVQFKEGYIRAVKSQYPFVDIIANLGVSSQATGWVDERGQVESFEVLANGPVFAQVRVKKKLEGDHFYDKLYTFYQDHFTVTVLSPDRGMILSRAYYTAKCHYEDSQGSKAEIDGVGDAENVSGKSPGIKWYATWGENDIKEPWGLSCVAVTPADNVCYWDCPAMAGLGFTYGRPQPVTMAYFLHGLDKEPFTAPDFARLDYERVMTPVAVRR